MFSISSVYLMVFGKKYFESAAASLRHKNANMDVLVSMGTSFAWLYGVALILIGYPETENTLELHKLLHGHAHNFETASVLITIISIGKYIEAYSKVKTVDKLSELAQLRVKKANLLKEQDKKKAKINGKSREIPVELLKIGDLVVVDPGSPVPSDGIVIIGRGQCDESMLTGESQPVHKEIGLKVMGGTIMTQGSLIIEVTRTSEDSTFNKIIKLVENAQNSKAPIQGFADRVSSYFVPFIVTLAILDWIVWLIIVFSDSDHTFLKDSSH